jgi:hexosaminidase
MIFFQINKWIKIPFIFLITLLIPVIAKADLITIEESCETYPVIPKPVSLTPMQGNFTFSNNLEIALFPYNEQTKKLADFICDNVDDTLNFQISSFDKNKSSNISIIIDKEDDFPSEGYELAITKECITIHAKTYIGAFWGVQTLRQLIIKDNTITIPCAKIYDYPRFGYRGLLLDVARHMFSVDFIKKFIDLMSYYKINTFHWHLTDDQGWRIEIKKHPQLQQISAFRDQTLIGHNNDRPRKFDNNQYGGYYTQEQIKEVVEYAKTRHVTIIPEIDLPGHCSSVLAAYPNLGCTKKEMKTPTHWGIYNTMYCAGTENVYSFLEDVFTEVLELFPSEYIHIGGDEARFNHWKTCENCQALMKEEGFTDMSELQAYFVNRIASFLKSHNRKVLGWDEILNKHLNTDVTIMSWRGIEGGITAAKSNIYSIMSPCTDVYFDYYQSRETKEPLAIGGLNPLKKVYQYDPIPKVLNKDQSKYILGTQACVWTEYIKTEKHVEYMTYPRAIAFCETAWSQKNQKNYNNFKKRLSTHLDKLKELDVNFRPLDKQD